MEFINIVVRSLIMAAAFHLHITNMKKTHLRGCSIACFNGELVLENVHVLTFSCQQSVNKYQTQAADCSKQEN